MNHSTLSPPRAWARWLWMALALVAVAAVAQQVFRWVDTQGVTHYGSLPPPGVKASPVAPPVRPEPAAVAQAQAQARKTQQAVQRADELRQREQEHQEFVDKVRRALTQEQLRACARAREQLAVLQTPTPAYRMNERGQRVYLEDSERPAEMARLRAEVAANCTQGPADPRAALRERQQDVDRRTLCRQAQERLDDLAGAGPRVPERDLADAREQVQRQCP